MPEAITRSPVTLKCLIVEGFYGLAPDWRALASGTYVKVYRVDAFGCLHYLWSDANWTIAQTRIRKKTYLDRYDQFQLRILHKRQMRQHYKRW